MASSSAQRLQPGSHGEISGSASAKQLPDVKAKMVHFRAVAGNAGNVYIGLSSSVTVPDGTQDVTSGYELDAGQEITLPTKTGSLEDFYIICDNAGDDLVYMTLVT